MQEEKDRFINVCMEKCEDECVSSAVSGCEDSPVGKKGNWMVCLKSCHFTNQI